MLGLWLFGLLPAHFAGQAGLYAIASKSATLKPNVKVRAIAPHVFLVLTDRFDDHRETFPCLKGALKQHD